MKPRLFYPPEKRGATRAQAGGAGGWFWFSLGLTPLRAYFMDSRPPPYDAMRDLTGRRLLLLDADGVLLRLPEGEALEGLEVLEGLLREPALADVLVVATGEWKRHLDLAALRGLFADDIARRIVGVTPEVEASDGFRPHVEIHAWLAAHPEIADYVVLESGDFWPRPPVLESAVFVTPGQVIGAQEVELLEKAFARMGPART